jgi:CheY-like chemotaxis protein
MERNETTRNLISAREEALFSTHAKSSFLATMSHEIRTPLNAIIGLTEIQLQNELPQPTYEDLDKIHNSGSTLLGIINDMLDISKIESGNFELIPVDYDVPSLINDTAQLNVVRIGSRQIAFELHVDETLPSKLYGDELRVKQIVNNILSNAFKYTRKGFVKLTIGWEKIIGNTSAADENAAKDAIAVVFTVSDTGIGIKQEDMEKLFSEYNQLDTKANRKIEGAGLGLSITKKLVEMMGGSITIESEYGVGSTFTARVIQGLIDKKPIEKQTAKNLESFNFMIDTRSRTKNLIRTKMPYGKVLVVDDVLTNLDVARGLMMPYELTIDCLQSGKEAIEKIRQAKIKYDVVFMDHMMPEMDGLEATRIIRGEIGTDYAKTVPIVALTANALTGSENIFIDHGFNAFISKPIDIMRLDAILNQFVRDKSQEKTTEARG